MTVQPHSPLELVQQLFVRLGACQIMVVDGKGVYRGLIVKKRWLSFLAEIEEER
jgi:chloride channel 3/4/5